MASQKILAGGNLNPLFKGFRAACRRPDRRRVWEWCEDHVVVDSTSPMPGKWRSDNSPWVKPVMEDFGDNRIRDISVKCAAQSAKTQTILNCACWAIAEDPGPAMWVMAAKDEAGQFLADRVDPTFDNCKPVASMMISSSRLEYHFPGMPFYFVGAGSKSKLQSKPIRWLFLDEIRNYPAGALDMVLKRTRAFWNARRAMLSTPDMKDDAVDRAYKAGDQRTFHICCPRCKGRYPLKFDFLKWDTTEETKPGGKWDFDRLAETIRLECPTCAFVIRDTPLERKALARRGEFVAMNPAAPKHRRSYHWNALLPPWVPWRSLVEEFIQARAAARNGDLSPLKTFVNESLGESWDDELGVIDDFGFIEDRKLDYGFDQPWAEEQVRFMAADRQERGGEHYFWVIRAFGLSGRSRLAAYGRCSSTLELEEIRRHYHVLARNAVIDSGWKANEVYRFCATADWKAFKGDDSDYFLARDKAGKTVRQLWQLTWARPEGERGAKRRRRIRLFRWSNNWTKDLLAEYMQGLIGEWTLPNQVGSDYIRQLTAEQRKEVQDSLGRVRYVWEQVRRDNHYLDCELMITVAAVITQRIALVQSSDPAKTDRPRGPQH